MPALIDMNSHYFVGLPDSLENYRRLLTSPELARVVISAVTLNLPHSAAYPYMSLFATTNEQLAEFVAKLDSPKVVPWCYCDPLENDAPRKLEYWIKQRGMRGVKFYPPRGWYPSDARAIEAFKVAEALRVPVFLHMGRTAAHPQLSSKFARPLELEDVGLACPNLKLVIGHGGAPWRLEGAHIAMGFPNFYFDLSTSGGIDTDFLKFVAEHRDLGLRRIILGTNNSGATNLTVAHETLARLAAAGFTAQQLQAIGHDNALALLAE